MATRAARSAAHPSPEVTNTPKSSGRDDKGRFTAGNRGGPGNPFARRVAELRSAFIAAATPEDLQRICQRLITMAALGDLAAAKLVLGYLLGKIPEPVNPDTLDLEECRLASQNPTCAEVQEIMQQRPSADLSTGFIRGQDVINSARYDRMVEELKKDPAETEDPTGAEANEAPAVTKRPRRRAEHKPAAAQRPSPNSSHDDSRTDQGAPPSTNGRKGPFSNATSPTPARTGSPAAGG
jgi:hypothetical protein